MANDHGLLPKASREQLDALYKDLCDHPSVVMVL